MNQTAQKFGYPNTAIAEYEHWLVLLRPQQVTLGSLVLVCKEPVLRFSEVSAAAFAEQHAVVGDIEAALQACYEYDKINYLMLMMVDPDVHYHVIPRYADPRDFAGQQYVDAGWPGPPALAEFVDAPIAELTASLKERWPANG